MSRRRRIWLPCLTSVLSLSLGWSARAQTEAPVDSAPAPTPPEASAEPPEQTTPPPAASPVLLPGDAPEVKRASPKSKAPALSPEAKREQDRQALESARVRLHVSYPGAWLELSNIIDDRGFRRVCPAPCDVSVRVTGTEARVVAPGMTPSNPFRIEAGRGTAQFRVDGGSQATRRWGIIAFAIGVPVALSGMGLWGYGKSQDEQGFQTAGIVVLSAGAVAILGSLPLLSAGATRVRDERGRVIAKRTWSPGF